MLLSQFIAQYPDEDREIGHELAKVAALAQTYDRAGKVDVQLKVAKLNTRVQVALGSKTTEPRPDPEMGLFFVAPDGSLTKNDPHEMFDRSTGEITEAADPNTLNQE